MIFVSRIISQLYSILNQCRISHIAISFIVLALLLTFWITRDAAAQYQSLQSAVIFDRHGAPLHISPNSRDHFQIQASEIPVSLKEYIVAKEDRFFYYHPGINPVSMLRAAFASNDRQYGGSTITQQLAKILLENEQNRTIGNKLYESWYALGLELRYRKETILNMYSNAVYMGNRYQGLAMGSLAYYDTPLIDTTPEQQLSLLATLSHPSTRNPWQTDHNIYAERLVNQLANHDIPNFILPTPTTQFQTQSSQAFELPSLGIQCQQTCTTSLDRDVHEAVRRILFEHLEEMQEVNINQGAVVIIDPRQSELISVIGSANPRSSRSGNQMNMAIQSRPTGSTIKPFIYANAFAAGLRPYTLVDDREYRYPIASGFPLYPKNYDGQYRGHVSLHESLSGSLNVPTVKVLEYVGLEEFYTQLEDKMGFQSLQDYATYEFGIALGGLEMDLLTLTHYFTAWPQQGTIQPLYADRNRSTTVTLPHVNIDQPREIFNPDITSLVHTILRDRDSAVTQFGLQSNLNIPHHDYGVKTGTSRDYHDSWIVGYTSDIVVGVWLGNADNTPMVKVSGQQGAGAVWHDVMQYLLTTSYNTQTDISITSLSQYQFQNSLEWGLPLDNPKAIRLQLLDNRLVHNPHQNDVFALERTTEIPLRASKDVTWYVDDISIATGAHSGWRPTEIGSYHITAVTNTYPEESETITVTVTE